MDLGNEQVATKTLIGVSFKMTVPASQYDPTKLVISAQTAGLLSGSWLNRNAAGIG